MNKSTVRGLACLCERHCLKSLSEADLQVISYSLRLTLSHFFTTTKDKTFLDKWSIDSMEIDSFSHEARIIMFYGDISWSVGGAKCKTFQAKISINTAPLLFRFKLFDGQGAQQFSIIKSHDGWALA